MSRVDELIALLPRSLTQEEGADAFLRGILDPIARIEAFHNVKASISEQLIDPSLVPDELVQYLSSIVGLGSDLPAANSLTLEQKRSLIPEIVGLWKRKGTRASWRDIILFLTGARSLILDWFHHRIITGSSLEMHLLPVPSTAPGGAYDYPEFVTDVWVMDVTGSGIDTDLLTRWLSLFTAANERINLFPAAFIEDLRLGSVLWTIEDATVIPPDGYRDDLTSLLDGSTKGLVSTEGNTFIVDSSIPIAAAPNDGQHIFFLAAINGEAEIVTFSGDDLGDDSYTIVITNDNGSGNAEVELFKYVAGTPTSLVIWTVPQVLVDYFPYRWSIDLDRLGAGATEVKVQWEGLVLGSHIDSTSPHTDGRFGFRGGPAVTDQIIIQTVLIWRPVPPRIRIGLNP